MEPLLPDRVRQVIVSAQRVEHLERSGGIVALDGDGTAAGRTETDVGGLEAGVCHEQGGGQVGEGAAGFFAEGLFGVAVDDGGEDLSFLFADGAVKEAGAGGGEGAGGGGRGGTEQGVDFEGGWSRGGGAVEFGGEAEDFLLGAGGSGGGGGGGW